MDLRHPSWPLFRLVVQMGFPYVAVVWNHMVLHVVQASFWLLPWRLWPSPWVPLLHQFTVSPKCFDTFDRSHNNKTHGTHM